MTLTDLAILATVLCPCGYPGAGGVGGYAVDADDRRMRMTDAPISDHAKRLLNAAAEATEMACRCKWPDCGCPEYEDAGRRVEGHRPVKVRCASAGGLIHFVRTD